MVFLTLLLADVARQLPDSTGKACTITLDPSDVALDFHGEEPELIAKGVPVWSAERDQVAMTGTFTLHLDHPPRPQPLQFPPWAPSRRVADPGKKQARKAQKKARRGRG